MHGCSRELPLVIVRWRLVWNTNYSRLFWKCTLTSWTWTFWLQRLAESRWIMASLGWRRATEGEGLRAGPIVPERFHCGCWAGSHHCNLHALVKLPSLHFHRLTPCYHFNSNTTTGKGSIAQIWIITFTLEKYHFRVRMWQWCCATHLHSHWPKPKECLLISHIWHKSSSPSAVKSVNLFFFFYP